jgi:hypothetical protein
MLRYDLFTHAKEAAMIDVLALSLALTLSAAPADAAPVPVAEEAAPTQCADATLAEIINPLSAAIGDPIKPDFCFEDCDGYPDVSCSGEVCQAVNRNCSIGQRGYVTCDGVTTFCAPCEPPVCDDGTWWFDRTGQCCNCFTSGGEVIDRYKCIGGQWVLQSSNCGPSANCPICP